MKLVLIILSLLFASVASAQEPGNPQPTAHGIIQASVFPEPSLQKAPDPPKPTLLHRVFDKKFLLVTGVNIGVSLARSKSISDCRRDHGIGVCSNGGYGPFPAREVVVNLMPPIFAACSYELKKIEDREDNKYKFWWTLPAANAAYNATIILQNATRHFGSKEKD